MRPTANPRPRCRCGNLARLDYDTCWGCWTPPNDTVNGEPEWLPPDCDAADEPNALPAAARRQDRRINRPIADDDRERIIAAWQQIPTLAHVAAATHRSTTTVAKILHESGIRPLRTKATP
jgi:hypothetical protein